MSEALKATGSCLCGAVKITASTMSPNIGACHCNMCRKWSGGPYLAVDCKDSVQIQGSEHVSTFTSSEWAERGFCTKCGTHLYYKVSASGQYIVSVGLFDLDTELNFDHQIFVDEQPSYYCFSNKTKNMTGEEVFAQFLGNE